MLHRPPLDRSVSLLLASMVCLANAWADDWSPNLTATATWHSNATNANRSVDQLDSLQTTADILAGQRYPFTREDSLHLNGHLAADWWPRYNDLMRGAVGARAEWRHTFGTDPFAPAIGIEGAVDAVAAKETGRRGVSTGITVSVRKRFNDLTRATVRHEVTWFDARYGTFDSAASETSFEVDRDLTPVARLSFTARFRNGDVVTYASGLRPDLEARAPNRIELNTFDRRMTAYRLDSQTWSGRLALARALDDSSAVVIAYELRETRRASLRFPDHLLSVALVHQF